MSKEVKSHSPLRDLIGFVFLAVSVFLLITLVTYDPLDPSLNTKVSGHGIVVHNFGGLVGSYVADFIMQLWGYASFLLPIALFGVTWAVVFATTVRGRSVRIGGFVVMVVSVSLILALIEGGTTHIPAWGGLSGYWTRIASGRYVGTSGSWIVALTLLAISLVLTIGLTFERFVAFLQVFPWLGEKIWLWFAPIAEDLGERVDKALAREGKQLRRGLEAIRKDAEAEEPEIGGKIKIAGAEMEKEEFEADQVEGLEEIPIVFGKASATQEMPKFHTQDFAGHEEKKAEKKKPTIYKLPDISLLEAPESQTISVDREELLANAQVLERKLKDFGVFGKVVEVQPGPVVTMYEFEPAPGVKVNQIARLNDDLALALKALSVRITPLPGKSVIGIEVANRSRQVVYLKEIICDSIFTQSSSLLTLALGKEISGVPFVTDLRKMPHLLVAGATGSGKSVSVNDMILSVLFRATPDEVRMILVDPKMLELSLYDHIPHLMLPVVTDPRKAAAALRWAVLEMEKRYRLLADLGVRNIEGYNKRVPKVVEDGGVKKEERPPAEAELPLGVAPVDETQTKPPEHTGPLPYIMIVIDELADLMMVSSREVEESIIRLAQMARAAGIHLLLATQRPSVDVITGVIKANMPTRISFQVSSKIDSRTILDANGAELLLGAGDMLFLPPGTSKLQRIHGAFVTDNEVKRVTDFWKAQGRPDYDETILKFKAQEEAQAEMAEGEDDEMYQQALNIVRLHRVASISMIQRKLRIGYNRAARIVERMEEEGLLAPGEVGKPREVRMSRLEP
ncbi:MAG: DNA translocase FtsK 4TM domain-containing protein [Pseudomonadota bacterium]